jgi:uncharacterized Zn finger protein (UPF0148 family)
MQQNLALGDLHATPLPAMQIPSQFSVSIAVSTDNGFIGRVCPEAECGRYFQVQLSRLGPSCSCPYCGAESSKEQLLSPSQRKQLEAKLNDEVLPQLAHDLFGDVLNGFRGSMWKVTRAPKPVPKPESAPEAERRADSEIHCAHCAAAFRVDGIFGMCPFCKTEDVLVYDASLRVILQQVKQHNEDRRYLRHGYYDLVSTFERFCRSESKGTPEATARYQNLRDAADAIRRLRRVELWNSLAAEQWLSVRRVFAKRHVLTHDDGRIDQRYLETVPEDRLLFGTTVDLSVEELESACWAIGSAIRRIVDGRPVT